MRVIVCSAMHHRQSTVKLCLNRLHQLADKIESLGVDLSFIYGCSTEADYKFLKSFKRVNAYKAPNKPLYRKFNQGVEMLKDERFDAAIMIGSDDYFDEAFLWFVLDKLNIFEHIAFRDIYFLDLKKQLFFYWKGYTNYRRGEPAGAGKCYTKRALEKLDYQLFVDGHDYGLDRNTFEISLELIHRFYELRQNNLVLVDVKDGKGLTGLDRFNNLTTTLESKALTKRWPL